MTRWRPVEARPLLAPRAGGQVLRAARRIYGEHRAVLARVGLIFVPLAALASAAQAGLFEIPVLESLQQVDTDQGSLSLPIALLVGGTGSLLAYVLLTAATAEVLRRDAAGEAIGALGAYRALLARWRSLIGALARATACGAAPSWCAGAGGARRRSPGC